VIGRNLSNFTITAKLGQGGMGEVYQAEDTKLGREVAIKVLPEEVSKDPERLARFEREAKVLASLNHPHIAALYQVEESDGVHFLVMELAAGRTLAELIGQGSMPRERALPIAKQIAEALEAAHQSGVIHRDLKPANIKVDAEDQVKVLDFGLAKAFDPAAASGDKSASASLSPTLTAQMTQAGMLLGTAAYMSPEQARGHQADKRSDIWAFGVVLWEMLTGKRLFDGPTVSDTLAAVLRADPEWETLGSDLPRPVHRLLRRCLERNPKERLHDIADARLELEEAMDPKAAGPEPLLESTVAVSASRRRPVWAVLALGFVLGATLAWLGTRWLGQTAGVSTEKTLRVASAPPAGVTLETIEKPILAISPDGERLVVVGEKDGSYQLYHRRIDQYEWQPINGTDNATTPFFSPGGEQVAFFADGKLKKVSLAGGSPQVLCDAPNPWGGSWGPDGKIVFTATDGPTLGLMSVSNLGGAPEVLTRPDRQRGESEHDWAQILPDGRSILFTIWKGNSAAESEIALLDTATGEITHLIDGSYGRITASGHLVYALADGIYVVPVDLEKGKINGAPVPIPEPVFRYSDYWLPFFDISATGTLAYLPGRSTVERQLVAVTREGSEELLVEAPGAYMYPAVSPDGLSLAVTEMESGSGNIAIIDLATGARNRLTREGGYQFPIWTPDGGRVIFASDRADDTAIYWRAADGSSAAERLLASTAGATVGMPYAVTPDGKFLAYYRLDRNEDASEISDRIYPGGIYLLALEEPFEQQPLLITDKSGEDYNGLSFSPDGRWVAYVFEAPSESGVFVQAFPGGGAQYRISRDDSSRKPVWAPNGRDIYFWSDSTSNEPSFMVASVVTEPSFKAGTPVQLFKKFYEWGAYRDVPGYSVFPDGERLLMVKPDAEVGKAEEVRIVTHWLDELERLVPTP